MQTPDFQDMHSRLKWLHWALKIGPWTIEVVLDAKLSSEMRIRRIHHSECDAIWEDETVGFVWGNPQ